MLRPGFSNFGFQRNRMPFEAAFGISLF